MANLDQQIQQAEQKLKELRAKAQKQSRKDEVRRKILYGSAALLFAEQCTPEQQTRFMARLHEKILRQSDRAFLGLAPLQTGDNTQAAKPTPPSDTKKSCG